MKTHLRLTIFFLCQALVFWTMPTAVHAGQTAAATLYVDHSTGNDTPTCGAVDNPCASLQQAVNLASSGDTLLVAGSPLGSIYSTSIDEPVCTQAGGAPAVVCIHDKELTILGGYNSSNWSKADPLANITIIDGEGKRRGLQLTGATSRISIEGFTIRSGIANSVVSVPEIGVFSAAGGGILAYEVESLQLKRLVFQNNLASSSRQTESIGDAAVGGGLAIGKVITASLAYLSFDNNQAKGATGQERGGFAAGGAVAVWNSSIKARQVEFRNNRALGGAGIAPGGSSDGRRADAYGGALALLQDSTAIFANINAIDNAAYGGATPDHAAGAYGGAIHVGRATLSLSDADLRNNSAEGAASIDGWEGAGGAINGIDAVLTLDRVKLFNNVARGGGGRAGGKNGVGLGGGIHLRWADAGYNAQLYMTNSIIAQNAASNASGSAQTSKGGGGGALALIGSTALIRHSTIANNQIGPTFQGQALVQYNANERPAASQIENSIVAYHANSSRTIAALYAAGSGNIITLMRGLWTGNTFNIGAVEGAVSNGDSTMITGNPFFISSERYDYHIRRNSAARAQAVSSTIAIDVIDIDGDVRNDGEPDLGADEYVDIGAAAPILALTSLIPYTTSLDLAWQINPTIENLTDNYLIVMRREVTGTSSYIQETSLNVGRSNRYRLEGLIPNIVYTIYIEAQNDVGATIAASNEFIALLTENRLYLPLVSQ